MSLQRYQESKLVRRGSGLTMAHDYYWLERPGAPAVIILHELFGLSDGAVRLADHLADLDPPFSVYLPSLFGRPGGRAWSNAARALCIRREFHFLATGKTSPITTWVQGLAEVAAQRAGGRPVGLIGMCLTGGLVFAAVAERVVGAGVASQPSLPIAMLGPITPARVERDLGTSPDDLRAAVASRTPLMMLRYCHDRICPAPRAVAAAAAFGGVGDYQVDSEDRNVRVARGEQMTMVEVSGREHSVLTDDLNCRARALVVDFLRAGLG
jgi:dienelactone hydrolase